MNQQRTVGVMTRVKTLLILMTTLALAIAPLAGAAAPSAKVSEDKNKLVLENDHVKVWFQGKKPMLKVFPSGQDGENESTGYGYKFTRLVEFRDLNGDGVPSAAEIVGTLNLHSASAFNVSQVQTDGSATLNLTLTDTVKFNGPLGDSGMPRSDAAATISIVFHIRDATETMTVDNVTFDVPRTAIKYDLIVAHWPWLDASADRLALEMDITGTLDADLESEVASASVGGNGTEVGALTWLKTADVVLANGSAAVTNVTTSMSLASENMTRLVFAYDTPGFQSLVHDPTIGVAESDSTTGGTTGNETGGKSKPVPGPGVAFLVAAAVGAVALSRRR